MLQQKSAITKAEDLILIHDVNISKPINIKKEMQDYVALQDLEYKMLKWEALRLVGKANEYAFKTELRYRKEFKKLPDHIQYEAREKFFKENIMHMSDEKADLLAEILEDIVNKKINKQKLI